MLLLELPDDGDPSRAFVTCQLADACAKVGYGHKYWLPRTALQAALDYVEGPWARVVRAAQREGRYEYVAAVGSGPVGFQVHAEVTAMFVTAVRGMTTGSCMPGTSSRMTPPSAETKTPQTVPFMRATFR